jgi:hypothetical protein
MKCFQTISNGLKLLKRQKEERRIELVAILMLHKATKCLI